MKMLPSKRPLLCNRWLKVLVVANTTLALTAMTSVAEAATINFRGSVTNLIASAVSPTMPSSILSSQQVDTLTVGKPATIQDTIVGSYTFGEADELLSARFRFVAPDSAASLDPSETDPLDIVFEPLPDSDINSHNPLIPGVDRITSARGSSTSASYDRRVVHLSESSIITNAFDVNASKFSYKSTYITGRLPFEDAGRTNQILGNIEDLYTVVDDHGSKPIPTDIPEPTTVLGLLMFAGIGIALTGRDRRLSTSPTSAKRV